MESSWSYESSICIYGSYAFMDGHMVFRSSWCCGFKQGWPWTLVASCGELASLPLIPTVVTAIIVAGDCYSKNGQLSSNNTSCYFYLQVLSVSLFWTGAVLCNIVHVIVSGLVFLVLIHGGRNASSMPPNSLMKSVRYAVTTSFGSICYGSLFTASIRTLRWEVSTPAFASLQLFH